MKRYVCDNERPPGAVLGAAAGAGAASDMKYQYLAHPRDNSLVILHVASCSNIGSVHPRDGEYHVQTIDDEITIAIGCRRGFTECERNRLNQKSDAYSQWFNSLQSVRLGV